MPQQPRELKELQKVIEAKRKMAFRDAGEAAPELRNNIEMAKNAAKQDLVALLKELDGSVTEQGLPISVGGPAKRVETFIKTLRDSNEGDVCVVDADSAYKLIADPVWESMSKRKGQPGSTEVALAIGGLRTVAVELGITEFQRPDFARLTATYMTDYDALVRETKKVVRAAGGDVLAAMHTHRKAVNFATDTKFSAKQMPIFIVGADKDLLAALGEFFKQSPCAIDLNNESVISEDFVVKSLAAVKKAAKK